MRYIRSAAFALAIAFLIIPAAPLGGIVPTVGGEAAAYTECEMDTGRTWGVMVLGAITNTFAGAAAIAFAGPVGWMALGATVAFVAIGAYAAYETMESCG